MVTLQHAVTGPGESLGQSPSLQPTTSAFAANQALVSAFQNQVGQPVRSGFPSQMAARVDGQNPSVQPRVPAGFGLSSNTNLPAAFPSIVGQRQAFPANNVFSDPAQAAYARGAQFPSPVTQQAAAQTAIDPMRLMGQHSYLSPLALLTSLDLASPKHTANHTIRSLILSQLMKPYFKDMQKEQSKVI
jgi:hypothetical protein